MIFVNNIDRVIDSFINGEYFIIFLIITLVILLVLVLALIKSREDYNSLINNEDDKKSSLEKVEVHKENNEFLSDFESLMAKSKDDMIDADKPLIKQVDLNGIKTYDDLIDEYESSEEENAVISTEELTQKARERNETLGATENQEAIAKYEEEQEKKAIISYEQLLKNASNITLSYKEEVPKEKGAPKVNKIEIEQKEITPSEMYLAEEEFLKILKEFRISL